jgi:hypothetical protein
MAGGVVGLISTHQWRADSSPYKTMSAVILIGSSCCQHKATRERHHGVGLFEHFLRLR